MKGLEQRKILHRVGAKVNRVQAFDDWSHEGQRRSTSSSLRFQLIWKLTFQGGFKFCKTAQESSLGLSLSLKWNSRVFNCHLCFHYFSCLIEISSLIPSISFLLRSVQGQVLRPAVGYRMASAKNAFSSVKKAMSGSLSPGAPYLICLQNVGKGH